jgi:hypothetical protein
MPEPLKWYDDNADNPAWIKALAEVRRLRELIETKERVDAELAEILGGASVKKERKIPDIRPRHAPTNHRLQRCDILKRIDPSMKKTPTSQGLFYCRLM